MATPRSPFLVLQNFLSPKVCESIVDELGFYTPDKNTEGKPIKMFRHNDKSEELIFDRLDPKINEMMDYYQADYKGTEKMIFEYLAEGTVTEPICENSNYLKKKWVRTYDRDFTCVLFLCNYNDSPQFDSEYEVYGGKLEFPQHGFGFNPERGTLIMYPSGPHFINANAAVEAGDLLQVRIHMACKLPYLYQPGDFPGDFTNWFKHLSS